MSQSQPLSVSDKLLLAAHEIEASGKTPFTAEDLVVSAWRNYPDTFGLAGYNDDAGSPAHPDSNRVFAEIMGTKPIRQRGLLKKVGTKMYQLTEAGRERARFLGARSSGPEARKIALSRDVETELRRLLSAKATDKYRTSRKDEITFHDACAFWGISPRSTAIELEGRIASLDTLANRGLEAVAEGAASFQHGGHPLGTADIQVLKEVAKHMERMFASELAVIRRRRDERA